MPLLTSETRASALAPAPRGERAPGCTAGSGQGAGCWGVGGVVDRRGAARPALGVVSCEAARAATAATKCAAGAAGTASSVHGTGAPLSRRRTTPLGAHSSSAAIAGGSTDEESVSVNVWFVFL